MLKHMALVSSVVALSLSASGQVPGVSNTIDFENAAEFGGDDAAIGPEYFQQHGVNITARAGASAASAGDVVFSFEASGRDGTDAFWNKGGTGRDEALSGSLGNYLMKAGAGDLAYNNAKYFRMDIDYLEPSHRAQAEIWDIDGPEQYQVTAYDENQNEIGTLTSPHGGLDGKPWFWRFQTSGDQKIASIEIEAIGTGSLRGFAFDNFEAHPGPIPAALPLGLAGLGLVALRRRRAAGKRVAT